VNQKLFEYEKFSLEQEVFFKEYHDLKDDIDVKLMKSLKACDNKSRNILRLRKSRK
jgi:hypothetical protein